MSNGIAQSVERSSTCLVSHCEWWYSRSQFRAPPMPACRYMEENSLAAKLEAKRSAGVTPEVNLREHVTCMPPPTLALKHRGDVTRSSKQGYQ